MVQQKADSRAGEGSPGLSAASSASTTPGNTQEGNVSEIGCYSHSASRGRLLQGLQAHCRQCPAALRHCTGGGCTQQHRGAVYSPVIHRSASAAAAKAKRHVTVDAAASIELPPSPAVAARPPERHQFQLCSICSGCLVSGTHDATKDGQDRTELDWTDSRWFGLNQQDKIWTDIIQSPPDEQHQHALADLSRRQRRRRQSGRASPTRCLGHRISSGSAAAPPARPTPPAGHTLQRSTPGFRA